MIEIISPEIEKIEPILARYAGAGRRKLLPLLLEVQNFLGYIPESAAEAVGRSLRVPLAEIHGVLGFYTMLYTRPTAKTMVRVCTSAVCALKGGEEALRAACRHVGAGLNQVTPDGAFMVEEVPCLGLCDHAPTALVGDVPVAQAAAENVGAWIRTPKPAPQARIGGSPRWLSGRCGVIDPTDLAAFQANGGFAGLHKALNMPPVQVVAEIKAAGLVGRGGAAFPAGAKWEMTAATPEPERYVVCNADESEPGTFKDRVIMEGDPFFILEGMLVAGYAIGSSQGYLYVRGEYPRAQRILARAIEEARKAGFLGKSILGTGFSFDIELSSGAGAYVCGEETALFESLDGQRGLPRLKPPFPTTFGLFGKPTVINNVETLCTAAWILDHGSQAYRSIGTKDSPGSKLFCLSGDVAEPGVYEVPFGTPLKDLLTLAGGVQGELQAVLLGGAAGTFARPEEATVPMSFEGLRAAGLALGSGVVVAINTSRSMRKILLSLAQFFAHESCGKCFPCQLGTQRQLEIIEKVAEGRAVQADMDALRDIGFTMTSASICGLGMTAGSAILSALQRWPEVFLDGR